MKVSNVTVCWAEPMASSMAGKISSPFVNVVILFPPSAAGGSRLAIERRNWSSPTENRCSIRYSTFFSREVRTRTTSDNRYETVAVVTMISHVGMGYLYSVVLPSKCSLSASASSRVWWTTPSR